MKKQFTATNNTIWARKLVNLYRDTLSLGYSEDSWAHASDLLVQFSWVTDLSLYHKMGSLMGEMYVSPSLERINQVCDEVENGILRHR